MIAPRRSTAALLFLFLVGIHVLPVSAAVEAIPEETISLELGSVFEIITAPRSSQIQNGWILTKDKTFIKADRSGIFRTRFTEGGTYTLHGEIRDSENVVLEARRIIIDVKPSSIDLTETGTGSASTKLLKTTPPLLTSGKIILNGGQQIVQFVPLNLTTVSMDLNLSVDSIADGNPENDADTSGTYFSENGTPLHVWFPETASREILLTAGDQTQKILITSDPSGAPVAGDSDIVISDRGNGTYRFETTGDAQALYTWNFGDGSVSFLPSPIHTYQANGVFDVSVEARNAVSGEIIHSAETSHTVTVPDVPVPDPTEPTEPENNEPSQWRETLIFIGKIIGGFVISLLVGSAIAFVISKVRGGSSLQEKIAEAEKRVTGKDPSSIIEVPTSMEVKGPEDEVELPAEQSPSPPEPEPVIQSEPQPEPQTIASAELEAPPEPAKIPDWLKEAQNETAQPATPVSEPAAPEPPTETEQPVEALPTQEPAPTIPEPSPEPAAVAPTPAPEPIVEAPAPEPVPEPVTVEQPIEVSEPQEPVPTPIVEEPVPVTAEPEPIAQAPAPVPTPLQEFDILPAESDDEPIATVHAESLEEQTEDQDQTQQKNDKQ